jgi:Zn-dependent protease with chaperone function
VLDGLEVRAFQSVLAHEFGHFSNQDTAGGGMALVGRRSLVRMGMALAQSGAATWYNPAWLFFRAYYAVYLRVSQGASRLQEVLADRVAIFSYGSAAFVAGYEHVIRQSTLFDAHVNQTVQEVVATKQPLRNMYRFAPRTPVSPAAVAKTIDEVLSREAGIYDSHPSSKDRLAWAALLDVRRASAEPSPRQVLDCFDDLEALELELTAQVRANVAVNHELFIRAGDEPEGPPAEGNP